MRILVAAFCLLGACLQAAEPPPDPAQEDRETIQGVWTAVELDGAGANVPKDAKEFQLRYKGDTVVFDRGAEKKEYRFRLPKQGEIDLIPVGGKDEGPTWLGSYHLSDDQLELCFWKNDPKKRPSGVLSAKIDVGLWVIRCSRPKP